jgi:hypothetical protein
MVLCGLQWPNMYPIKTTIAEGLALKEGDEADLRVVMQDGAIVVTKILRLKSAVDSTAADYKVKLGAWNRK